MRLTRTSPPWPRRRIDSLGEAGVTRLSVTGSARAGSTDGTDGTDATRVYELLHRGGFGLLRLTDARDPHAEACGAPAAGRGPLIGVVTARATEEHPELGGVREVLVRPDGHVARATRSADAGVRRTGREGALSTWAALPPIGPGARRS
ncbi:hypothetical protein [Streptomyces sp. NPDC085540]|uniref:aromatic-ring hydroxylase C-terminal domain-containing protein n=1 Tax=Streptomyces sp. NPDC085540 TaxID=3365730 RepID=UPI0037CD42A6